MTTLTRRTRLPTIPRPSEHKLQVQVLQLIACGKSHPDILAFAIPNAAKRSFQVAMRMKAEGLLSGVADVCIMLPDGKAGWLELKTLKGVQSDAQKGFAAICERLSHPYALARTLDEAATILRKWGVLR